jgi:hypothetical protein
LAEHLAVFIARGVVRLDHRIARTFFRTASPSLRGHVHAVLGQDFSQGEIPSEVLHRGMALWDARLMAIRDEPAANIDELRSFGAWFEVASADAEWRVRHLVKVLRLTGGRIDHAWQLLESLEGLAEFFPSEALAAVRLLSQPTGEAWEIVAGRDHIRKILTIGLSNPNTRTDAESLTHELGARGYTQFRSVLEQH